jgi:hypothetical protein
MGGGGGGGGLCLLRCGGSQRGAEAGPITHALPPAVTEWRGCRLLLPDAVGCRSDRLEGRGARGRGAAVGTAAERGGVGARAARCCMPVSMMMGGGPPTTITHPQTGNDRTYSQGEEALALNAAAAARGVATRPQGGGGGGRDEGQQQRRHRPDAKQHARRPPVQQQEEEEEEQQQQQQQQLGAPMTPSISCPYTHTPQLRRSRTSVPLGTTGFEVLSRHRASSVLHLWRALLARRALLATTHPTHYLGIAPVC